MVELTNHKGVMLNSTEDWCKINMEENWFVLSKITWEIWKIFTGALESLEIETSMRFFYPKLENVWA